VNQVEIALVAVAVALLIAVASPWIWARIRQSGPGAAETTGDPCRAAFEQSPNGILLVDAETLRIIDANPSLLRTLSYSLEEILPLDLSRVFTDQSDNSEALLRKLRDPNPRMPFQVGQLCKNGTLLNVEIRGHRLDLTSRHVLAFTTDDVSVRRKVEAQLLEKQQHLDHLAHHDQLSMREERRR